MAELTPLDEKLGEVLGLAQAAQEATTKVAGMEGGQEFRSRLEQMKNEEAETEQRPTNWSTHSRAARRRFARRPPKPRARSRR